MDALPPIPNTATTTTTTTTTPSRAPPGASATLDRLIAAGEAVGGLPERLYRQGLVALLRGGAGAVTPITSHALAPALPLFQQAAALGHPEAGWMCFHATQALDVCDVPEVRCGAGFGCV
jgi:hypothetical protein